MWPLAGSQVSRRILFTLDNDLVVPTEASVRLLDPKGNFLAEKDLEVEGTQATATFPGELNQVPEGETLTERHLVIQFTYEGTTHVRRDSYVIAPFYPLRTTPADVRSELGLDVSELKDDEVDLLAALLTLGSDVIDALSTPGVLANAANEAVKCKAALNLVGSLQFRVGVQLKAEENTFARMNEFHPAVIEIHLAQKLDRAVRVITGEPAPQANSFALSNPADPITGA